MAVKIKEYLAELAKRKKDSRIYKPYQLYGLEIADILDDMAHKALYMKLAKEYDAGALRRLAKSVAEKRDVKNKGAYFMSVFTKDFARNERPPISAQKTRRGRVSAKKNKRV